jgi:alpha-tubulin suppressor-like RCC1 family protein
MRRASRPVATAITLVGVLVLSVPHAGQGVARQRPGGGRLSVAAGLNHVLGIRTDGSVITWGQNEQGQLGRGTRDAVNVRRAPEVLPGISTAIAAAAGQHFSLLLLADGTVRSWGENGDGQLGHGPAGTFPRPGQAMPPVPTPARVVGLTGVTQVVAGMRFALALRSDGTVVAWGDGHLGALGDGKGTGSGSHYAVPFPRPVTGLSRVIGIAAGYSFGLALRDDGSVWGWGANEYGQLGDAAVDFKATPVRLAALSNVRSIHATGRTGIAVLGDGAVVAWGRNEVGLLDAPDTKRPGSVTPVRIGGLAGVREIATSSMAGHVLALMPDGTVRAWGDNSFSQISRGPVVEGKVLVPVKGVAMVAAGGAHSFYVMADGRVLTTGFRMANLVDRVPREVARLDPATATRCEVPPGGLPGSWSIATNTAAPSRTVTRADQTAALATASAFQRLLTVLPRDAVINESEGTRFIRDARPALGNTLAFGFRAQFLLAVCDSSSGRLLEIGSTGSTATLVANDLTEVLEAFGTPVSLGGAPTQLYRIAPRDGMVGGLPAFRTALGRAVVVARGEQSPYATISRGEFLDAMERHWESQGASTSGAMADAIKAFEAQIEQARKDLPADLRDTIVAEMERNLTEMKARLPVNQATLGAGVSAEVNRLRQYRQRAAAADLARPAVLNAFGFPGAFSDADVEQGRTIVRLNPQYFADAAPRHAVQVLVLSWVWSPGHPQDEAWRARFETTFAFQNLPGLLDR